MSSYESDIKERIEKGSKLPEKLDFSVLSYLWKTGPLSGNGPDNLPKFLRGLAILKNLTDNELRILANFFHLRKFRPGEAIFSQYETGVGFYILFRGSAEVVVKGESTEFPVTDTMTADGQRFVISLTRGDYFGELALLQDSSIRSATARAVDTCEVLGLFGPDLEDMMQENPVVAAKLLKSLSTIIAHRLYSITKEVGDLKSKITKLEKENEEFKKNRA